MNYLRRALVLSESLVCAANASYYELMIPQEKSPAVRRGLKEAFGVSSIDDLRRITHGLSSDLQFRVVVQGAPYLLRIMTRMDERNDPTRIFACMNAAAEAGLAPRVRYSNAAEGIAIIDWIETVPFSEGQALSQIPAILRRLHLLPAFPKTFNYVTSHDFFVWRLRTANLLPETEIEEVFRSYKRICAVYPRLAADLVPCHMDPKPDNILFDGRRVWLIDWTAAFLNDRYFDLAIAANFIVTSDADERSFLAEYFGQPPDEHQRARFLLMRQATHMLSAAVFLLLGSAGKPIGVDANPPSFRRFHQRMWAGEIDLSKNELKIAYGRVHWRQLLRNIGQPQFAEAIRIVESRSKRSEGVHLLFPDAPKPGS